MNLFSRSLVLFQIVSLGVFPPGLAWAQSTSAYINAATLGPIPANATTCDQICPQVVDPNNQKAIGPDGADGWSASDDVYCANHGVVTNPNIQPNTSLAANTNINCSVPVLPGDTSCATANQAVLRCEAYNTQLSSDCMAYEADKGATPNETNMLIIDGAAAVTCLTACMAKSSGLGGALDIACSAAGITASATEIMYTLNMKSSMSKAMDAVAGAAGLASSAITLVRGVQTISSGAGSAATGTTTAGTGAAGSAATGGTKASSPNKGKKSSCVTAIVLAALAGLRGFNIMSQNNLKTNQCNTIQSLLTSNGIGLPGSSGGSASGSTTTPGSASSSGTTTTSSSSGGSIATVVVPTSTSAGTTAAAIIPTVNSPTGTTVTGSSTTPPTKSATQLAQTAGMGVDGNLLSNSGLGPLVAPLAQTAANNPTTAGQAASGDAAGVLGSGFGASNGAAGRALADVARSAQDSGISGNLASAAQSVYGAGGGAPGAAKGGGEDENPFAKLNAAAAGAGGDNAGSPSSIGFEKPLDPCLDGSDIWHSNCRGTIFDVISGRINRSRSRVQTLPWSRSGDDD